MAERLARINKAKILIIEQRNHIGGNCYDCYDERGILIHPYGPHIFHTDNKDVWTYLSKFTDWHYYQHRVVGMVDGQIVPIPFNINTLYDIFPKAHASRIEEHLIATFGFGKKVSIMELKQTEDSDLRLLAEVIHEKIFLNYTVKQWGVKPDKISSEIFNRVPVVISKDDRYFHDAYQGLPKYGYTKMFEKMLNHPNIKILLNTHMREVVDLDSDVIRFMGNRFDGQLIYTGKIDELFEYKFGELPYRAIEFDHETLCKNNYQNFSVVNYPNNYDFTRITEFKHMTGQTHPFTSILREFPCWHDEEKNNVPCYPVPTPENYRRFEKYMKLINKNSNLVPIGRLAEYKYYDMDDMVARALDVFDKKLKKHHSEK